MLERANVRSAELLVLSIPEKMAVRRPDRWIWLGRRAAYLGAYNHAIAIYARSLERILASPQWAPFGYIAAEADLARLRAAR